MPQYKCPICLHNTSALRENEGIVYLNCGHETIREKLTPAEFHADQITSVDNKKLYDFQVFGVNFGIATKSATGAVRVLYADEMALGKTIQGLGLMKLEELKPCLFFCKSTAKIQMMREILRWCGFKYAPQVIESARQPILNLPVTILSYELAAKMNGKLAELKPQLMILDECHKIKNTDTKAYDAIEALSHKIPNIIGLSGTPIKNSAAEFFAILHILRPDLFPNEEVFIRQHIATFMSGKTRKLGGLKDPAKFRELTKDFIIRRERHEVLPDLPLVNRTFHYTELPKDLEAIYKEEMEQFLEDFDPETLKSKQGFQSALGRLNHLRNMVGTAKVDAIVDLAIEFIGSAPEEEKLVIFMHHSDATLITKMKLDMLLDAMDYKESLHFKAGMDAREAQDLIDAFRYNPKNRIMIASTLAGGESINLQFCSNCIVAERQWNPANEEQAESRFPRPGTKATQINAMYLIALRTIDEYFTQLIEIKREICGTTMGDSDVVSWDESSLIRELIEVLRQKHGTTRIKTK